MLVLSETWNKNTLLIWSISHVILSFNINKIDDQPILKTKKRLAEVQLSYRDVHGLNAQEFRQAQELSMIMKLQVIMQSG